MNRTIVSAEKVESYFGYWPEFCDAKVENLSYAASGAIELSLFYVDVDRKKSASVSLCFFGVTEVKLNELRSENIIDQIKIESGNKFTISIDSAFGLCGSFSCSGIEVKDVRAK